MKTLGLIGGISWVSTADYYSMINKGINDRLGGLNFSQCIIYSFNYADIKRNNEANDWEKTFEMLLAAARQLTNAGAEAILLCANTMHMVADRLQNEIDVPLIHIADVTASAIQKQGVKKVGLLGTKFTMEQDFFTSKLTDKGIDFIIPGEEDREFIHETIFYELGKGIVTERSKKRFLSIIHKLAAKGADGIILGCTEIPLIVKPEDTDLLLFDTALLHSEAAVAFSLNS